MKEEDCIDSLSAISVTVSTSAKRLVVDRRCHWNLSCLGVKNECNQCARFRQLRPSFQPCHIRQCTKSSVDCIPSLPIDHRSKSVMLRGREKLTPIEEVQVLTVPNLCTQQVDTRICKEGLEALLVPYSIPAFAVGNHIESFCSLKSHWLID
jgi:hypothetical protein